MVVGDAARALHDESLDHIGQAASCCSVQHQAHSCQVSRPMHPDGLRCGGGCLEDTILCAIGGYLFCFLVNCLRKQEGWLHYKNISNN